MKTNSSIISGTDCASIELSSTRYLLNLVDTNIGYLSNSQLDNSCFEVEVRYSNNQNEDIGR